MKFKFPFPAYEIQNSFMKCMYDAIKEKKVCLIESPTGTVIENEEIMIKYKG